MEIQNFTCPCCGFYGKWLILHKLPKFMFGIPFTVLKCPVCGLGRTMPTPDYNKCYYVENEHYEDLFLAKRDLYYSFASNLFSSFENLIKKTDGLHLLDIGCGGGFTIEYANSLGYITKGLETNTKLVNWCQNRGLNVINGDANDLGILGNQEFDVIILSSILEHLSHPYLLMNNLNRFLAKNGIVVISQANYRGLLPTIFPWGWYGWQPQEHFWHFTPASIAQISWRSGFTVIQLQRDSLYHPWFIDISNLKEFVGRNIASMFAKIGTRLGMGDCFIAILQSNKFKR